MALFDSIFGTEFYLREDSIGGKTVEEDNDDYSEGDNNQPEQQSDQNENQDQQDTNQEEDDTDYESEVNNDSEDNQDGNDQANQEDDTDYESEVNNDSEDNQDQQDTNQEEDDDTDYESEVNNDSEGDDSNQSSDTQNISSTDDPNSQLKELEKSIFDQLSPEQQTAKIKELKSLYIATYNKCQKIIAMVSEVDKLPSQARIYDYIVNSLVDLQKYIRDYLDDLFDSKAYMENMTELQKYLVVLDTVNGVFEEMRKNAEDADK